MECVIIVFVFEKDANQERHSAACHSTPGTNHTRTEHKKNMI